MPMAERPPGKLLSITSEGSALRACVLSHRSDVGAAAALLEVKSRTTLDALSLSTAIILGYA
jgi:hypothetical protein